MGTGDCSDPIINDYSTIVRYQGTNKKREEHKIRIANLSVPIVMKTRKISAALARFAKKRTIKPSYRTTIVGPNDIICGRGKPKICHAGNKRMRLIVSTKKQAYKTAGKHGKADLIQRTIDEITECGGGPDARFLKQAEGEEVGVYCLATNTEVWDKISHCLRERKNDPGATSEVMKTRAKAVVWRKELDPNTDEEYLPKSTYEKNLNLPRRSTRQSIVLSSDFDVSSLDSISLEDIQVSPEDLDEQDFCLFSEWSAGAVESATTPSKSGIITPDEESLEPTAKVEDHSTFEGNMFF